MRIFAINSNNNFKGYEAGIDLGTSNGLKSEIAKFTSYNLAQNRIAVTNRLSSDVYDSFTRNFNEKIGNIEKFSLPYNKAHILKEVAVNAYNTKDYDNAGVVLGKSFEMLSGNLGIWEKDKQILLKDPLNQKILKDFFYSSVNYKAKYQVMKSLNTLNSKRFLNIAQAVCNYDDDIVSPNDKKTIVEAREYLAKNYDLKLLEPFIDKNDNYKIAVLRILSKWGTKKDVELAQKLIDDKNIQVADFAEKTISKLRNLEKPEYVDDDFDDDIPRTVKLQDFYRYLSNYIDKGEDLELLKISVAEEHLATIRQTINSISDVEKKNQLKLILANISDRDIDLEILKLVDDSKNDKETRMMLESYLKLYVKVNSKEK